MPRRLLRQILTAKNFVFSRQKGSHRIFTKPGYDGHVTVAAGQREVPVGTLAKIIRQSGLNREDFGI